jgi:hypothetical protein
MKRRGDAQGIRVEPRTRTPSAEPPPRVKHLPRRRRCSRSRDADLPRRTAPNQRRTLWRDNSASRPRCFSTCEVNKEDACPKRRRREAGARRVRRRIAPDQQHVARCAAGGRALQPSNIWKRVTPPAPTARTSPANARPYNRRRHAAGSRRCGARRPRGRPTTQAHHRQAHAQWPASTRRARN